MNFWKRPRLTEKEQKRLLGKIKVNPDTECWEWQACKDKHGYGRFSFRSKTTLSHRLVYEWLVGEISEGKELDHARMNDNPELCSTSCCNPYHLEAVPHQINMSRSKAVREAARVNGKANGPKLRKHDLPNGVFFSGKNFMARIHDPHLNRRVYLGTYDEPELAARAHREARIRIDMGLSAKNPHMISARGK